MSEPRKSHQAKPLSIYNSPADEFEVNSSRNNLTVPGARAFSISNFLSKEECRFYISEAERLSFEGIDWEYAKDYRDCVRVLASSDEFADILWRRIISHLTREDFENVRPYGFGATKGTWAPAGVNPMIRFSKYNKGGHFQRHRDGGFVIHDDLRSIFTVLIFLNDDFMGGETTFYSDVQGDSPCLKFNPAAGTAVIFNHDCRHAGEIVEGGVKYILRTDIMFQRIDMPIWEDSRVDRNYQNFEDYKEAERLYQLSIELQKNGDPEGSTKAYLSALEMHAKLPSIPPEIPKETHPFLDFPKDVWYHVCSYLDLVSIGRFCQTSKFSRQLIDSQVWRGLYVVRYERSVVTTLNNNLEENWNKMRSGVPIPYSFETSAALSILQRDWRALYRYKYLADKYFQVVCIDMGAWSTKYMAIGLKEKFNAVRSKIHKRSGHYWSAGSGSYEVYLGTFIGKETPDFAINSCNFYPFPNIINEDTTALSHTMFLDALETSVVYLYEKAFTKELPPRQHPLLLAVPSFITPAEKVVILTSLFADLAIPYISLVDSSLLTLHTHGLSQSTAIVASVGCRHLFVRAFKKGRAINHYVRSIAINDWLATSLDESRRDDVEFLKNISSQIISLICESIEGVDDATRETLFANVVLTGGRAVAVRKFVLAGLSDVFTFPVRINMTENPSFDVIHGCESYLSLPESKDGFIKIDSVDQLPPKSGGMGDSQDGWMRPRILWQFTRQKLFHALGKGRRGGWKWLRGFRESDGEWYIDRQNAHIDFPGWFLEIGATKSNLGNDEDGKIGVDWVWDRND
ncbi:hypothetical protein HK098_004292 [Nowakowskiella sp. JEL0407]|nr:hypothetical protein HK098_004292 [Nowakowskiella sp. JEL0407]